MDVWGEVFSLPMVLRWGEHNVCASLQYGDYDPNVHKRGFLAQEELLPKRVRGLAVRSGGFPRPLHRGALWGCLRGAWGLGVAGSV